MNTRLADRVVAVTGAGSGLGLLATRALLDQGATVVANYRSSVDSLAALREQHPGRVHTVHGDVGDEASAIAIADVARGFGRLDVLIHNAGISRDGPLIQMTAEDWDEVVRVNLRGAFLTTKHALRVMIRRRYGRLIYVSSLAGVMGNGGQANYAASKAALHGLSHAVAQEYSSRGIRSVVLAPGLLDVGIGAELAPALLRRKAERTLLGVGDASTVAGTLAFLSGPEADFINAAVLRSDGGVAF